MTGNYVLYHCHSDYSLLDSCTKFEDYVDLAVESGQKAIASTEHGKPLGWISKKLYCDSKGIRFLHGVEIYLTEQLAEKVRDNYHTVLIARNAEGVRELNRLVSKSCDKEHFYYTNRISFDEFLGISDNIISTSACLASPLNKLPEDHPRYMELARKYTFLEVQPHICEEQAEYNKRLFALAEKLGKKLIAGTDTHSSGKYKAECRKILMSAKHKSYGDEDNFDLTYKTYDELVEMFRYQGALPEDVYMEAIENTNLLYDMTEDFELDKTIKYPILYGSRDADDARFEEVVETRFRDKLASGIIPAEQEAAFRNAINEEMDVFRKLKMTGFMLSMSELISWCKEQGMAIGTARGSVGGSRIAYITDIINLNPETWHTVFSRFANSCRQEIGDQDVVSLCGNAQKTRWWTHKREVWRFSAANGGILNGNARRHRGDLAFEPKTVTTILREYMTGEIPAVEVPPPCLRQGEDIVYPPYKYRETEGVRDRHRLRRVRPSGNIPVHNRKVRRRQNRACRGVRNCAGQGRY